VLKSRAGGFSHGSGRGGGNTWGIKGNDEVATLIYCAEVD